MVAVLVNVAFITLIERKVLRYSQRRVGPNKPSFIGVLQPAADAVKLFSKNIIYPIGGHLNVFSLSPFVALTLVLWVWLVIPKRFERSYYYFSSVFLLIIIRLNVYPLLLRGWASSNKYSIVGALRRVAQTISYEVRLALLMLIMLIYSISLPLDLFSEGKQYVLLLFVAPFAISLWLISRLAETNRTPFDFSEGESELVSGFNTEYRAGGFAVIFIAEYGSIYFLRFVTSFIFCPSANPLPVAILARVFLFFWVWARSTYPRYRYDLLIRLAWKRILPLALAARVFIARVLLY